MELFNANLHNQELWPQPETRVRCSYLALLDSEQLGPP